MARPKRAGIDKENHKATARQHRSAYRDLLENFKLGISIIQDGDLVYVNQAISDMHGYLNKEAFTNNITNFIAPEDLSRLLGIIDDLIAGVAVVDCLEYRAFKKDGSTFPVEVSAQLIEWNGKPAVLNTITDISDRKRAEVSEFRLGRIVERSLNEIYVFDAETLSFVDANLGARTNLGYTLEELKTLTPVDIKPNIDAASFNDITRSLVDGKQSKAVFETVHQRKDCSTYDVEVHLEYMGEEQPPVYVAIIQDITERKQQDLQLEETRRSLEESEAFLRQSAEIAELGYAVWDESLGRDIFVSERLAKFHGVTKEEYLANITSLEKYVELVHPDDRDKYLIYEDSDVGFEIARVEYRILKPDGEVRDLQQSSQHMVDQSGKPTLSVIVIQDVTERKRMTNELKNAVQKSEEASRAKSEFIANMSHELRTPLNSVIGFSEIMSAQSNGPLQLEKCREYAEEIHSSGRHLLSIVNDILDLSKIEAGKMDLIEEAIDVGALVNSCLRMMGLVAKDSEITLTTEIANNLPKLFADERLVKQMILNLLSNAIKFSKSGGHVTVGAELAQNSCLNINVSDTGIGIPSDGIQKALSPFGQIDGSLSRSQGGTGLGLPLVISLIGLHGGTFKLNSEQELGTIGTLSFPSIRVVRNSSEAPARTSRQLLAN